MRNLILLRGAPGSGKSTFVKNNNLQDWTISADSIRQLFQSPVTRVDGGKEISQKNDNKVWDFLYTITEERMIRGELVIIDATHSRSQWLTRYKELSDKYRYRVYAVEFMPELETVLLQNKSRESLKYVPEEYIKKSYEFIKLDKLQGWIKKISKEEFLQMVQPVMETFDFSKYSKIHHIGDLHGCFDPFYQYFENVGGLKEDEMWIFVGDYTDRGIQNGKLMRFLLENFMGKKNVLFLEGNHEKWGRMWSNGESDSIKSKEFKFFTAPDLAREGIEMSSLREFYRRVGQIAWYSYNGINVFVNHAGCPNRPSNLTTTDEYIHGIGKYEDILEIQNSWNVSTPINCYQVHGHRNVGRTPIINGRCFNLTDEIEHGGYLRIATLDSDLNWETFEIKNNVFKPSKTDIPEVQENAEKMDEIAQLLNSKDVIKKNLGNHVVSFNFSRDVFYDKKWNEITTKARGLFVNVTTGKIVARSWDKFFNIEERDETTYTALKRNMKFPAVAYIKENGFLGMIGYNEEFDEIFISSKSTNDGEFVSYFKEVIDYVGFDLEKAKSFCKDNNATLVFEVVHPEKDPHIIEYGEKSLFLINIVSNAFDYDAWKYDDLVKVAEWLGVFPKTLYEKFSNWSEFSDWYASIENNIEYKVGEYYIEGFVVECADGFMFKIKTEWYKFWKKMRGVADKFAKGRVYNTAWLQNPFEIQVYSKIKEIPREEIEKMSIIEVRNRIGF